MKEIIELHLIKTTPIQALVITLEMVLGYDFRRYETE